MNLALLLVFQLVSGQGQVRRFIDRLEPFVKKIPIDYNGDGGNGGHDYMRYVISKALPSAARLLNQYYDSDPPRRTNLRFSSSSVSEVMASFNASLVSMCPMRMLNRNLCTVSSTYSDVTVLEEKSVDAVVVVMANNRQSKIVVSYRATVSAQNWLDNFNAELVDVPTAPEGVKVHRGIYLNYLATFNKVRGALKKLLDDHRFKDYSVLVTGYSLGGGAAYIAMSDITRFVRARQDPRHVELITFAAPRTGNPAYAAYLASLKVPVTRLTLSFDSIPHLPFRSSGYTHGGQEIHVIQPEQIGRYSIKVCSQEYDEDPACAWSESDAVTITRHEYPFGAPYPKPPLS
ncbi:hypothetical protein DSO57_1003384 [Entomophthora muscae]|uniref:Uncharacterized protein n=1 Tax=Entomophthora muscae TaxID=34485 RepID=A0ACC2TJR8_9FUNG|nr:hypothetical protein DSO57_1003384 [Entomophthora muscae]